MRTKILGSAAGGGFPQWNCACRNCSGFRRGSLKARARTQAQVAVSTSVTNWVLLNASPDLREQILAIPEFAPSVDSKASPVSKIVLTSADVDSVMGLLHLREFQPLHIYCTSAVRRVLTEENSLFRVLNRSTPPAHWEILPLGRLSPLVAPSGPATRDGLFCKAIPLFGDFPDYVSDSLRRTLSQDEAVVGIQLFHKDKLFFFAPSLPGIGEQWRSVVDESDFALLDGTFWTDNELIAMKRGKKSARDMGHLPLSGVNALLQHRFRPGKTRKVLMHINNTNPILDENSPEHRQVLDAGFEIAYDGMEFNL